MPGTNDPCLGCGKIGSDAYTKCHMALAAKIGPPPPCAQAGIKKNQQEIANAGIPIVSGIEQGITGSQGLQGIISAFQTLTSPETWVRVGLFSVALVFLIIGMMILVSHEQGTASTNIVSE